MTAPTSLVLIRSIVVTLLAVSIATGEEDDLVRERYERFVAQLRVANTLEFRANVVVTRFRGGTSSRSTGSIEASLARGDRGRLFRSRDPDSGTAGSERSSAGSIEILADGDVAYQVDREAAAFVKLWPPRFLAGGEGRSIAPLRWFLEGSGFDPVSVSPQAHPKQPELTGFRLDYDGWNEVAYFDREGVLRIWVRTDDVDGMRSSFRFDSFSAEREIDPATFARRPPDSFRDATSLVARDTTTTFVPADDSTLAASVGVPRTTYRALAPGARNVDAGFVDASGALVRLSAIRGRPVVLVFLDREAPQCADAAKRLVRLAVELEAAGSRTQILAVIKDDPPTRRRDAPKNLRFVRPASRDVERMFGVYYHPTTFVIDRSGSVVLRGSIGFDESTIRELVAGG